MDDCTARDTLKDHLRELKNGVEDDILIPLAGNMNSALGFMICIVLVVVVGEFCTFFTMGMGTDPTGITLGRILTGIMAAWLVLVRRRSSRQRRAANLPDSSRT